MQVKIIVASNLDLLADKMQSYLAYREESTPANHELIIADINYFFKTDYADNFKVLIISYHKKSFTTKQPRLSDQNETIPTSEVIENDMLVSEFLEKVGDHKMSRRLYNLLAMLSHRNNRMISQITWDVVRHTRNFGITSWNEFLKLKELYL